MYCTPTAREEVEGYCLYWLHDEIEFGNIKDNKRRIEECPVKKINRGFFIVLSPVGLRKGP
ncbi:hypothetical protein ACTXT7_013793 [Hymenolepis weldensis]